MDVMDNVKPPFKCAACSKEFSVKSHLNDHLYNHIQGKSLINVICRKGFYEISELNEYFRSCMIKNSWICDICNAVFFSKSDLKNHHSVHPSCKPCSKVFDDMDSLHAHNHEHHTEMFICEFCDKKFSLKNSLIRHLWNLHGNPKPYTCTLCNKKFSQENALQNHSLIHKKTKIFTCEICNKQFRKNSAESDLEEHLSVHPNKTYVCKPCKKIFENKSSLCAHIAPDHKKSPNDKKSLTCPLAIHNRDKLIQAYTCTVCNEQFSHENALKKHCQIHKKAEIFTCEFCNKHFGSIYALKKHLNIHTKPYSCKHCDKKFSSKSSLKLHLVAHSRDKVSRLLNLPEGVFEKIFKC